MGTSQASHIDKATSRRETADATMALWGQGDPRWKVEQRDDGTNTNNWHWTEKNVKPFASTLWKEELLGLRVESEAIGAVTVKEVTKCTGDVILSNRKGKLITYFELDIEAKWEGVLTAADDDAADDKKASGTFTIPNVSEENDADEIEINDTLKKDT